MKYYDKTISKSESKLEKFYKLKEILDKLEKEENEIYFISVINNN